MRSVTTQEDVCDKTERKKNKPKVSVGSHNYILSIMHYKQTSPGYNTA